MFKKKSFKDFLINQEKKNTENGKENRNSVNMKESNDIQKKLQLLKMAEKQKESKKKEKLPSFIENIVDPLSLFPANIPENNSGIIEDHSIKTSVKILSTQSMEWVNSVTFNQADIETKEKLEKVMSYYVYPAQLYSLQKNFLNSQRSGNSKDKGMDIEKINKEWFISFKD